MSVGILVLALSLILTGVVRRYALHRGLLDVPNARSSHELPTPRGGGVAIVVAATLGLIVLFGEQQIGSGLFWALAGGGGVVAVVGYADDRYHLPPGLRLAIHMLAAAGALLCLGGLPPLQIGDGTFELGWAGHLLALFGVVWILNLFNFMDGIDGIAASEAVFITLAGVLIARHSGHSGDIAAAALVIAAASLGFLPWNLPRARIFMGDAGSGYLGFVIAVLAVGQGREHPAGIWIWLILGATFFADATVTLVRRALRRERLHEAHRSHAYQWLARRWRSHGRVTAGVLGVNLLWLLPLALHAERRPDRAASLVLAALVPLCLLALIAGAGRRE